MKKSFRTQRIRGRELEISRRIGRIALLPLRDGLYNRLQGSLPAPLTCPQRPPPLSAFTVGGIVTPPTSFVKAHNRCTYKGCGRPGAKFKCVGLAFSCRRLS